MLWNWYTINSCFIADSWHVRSKGGFAGSCIGVILLVITLEGVRRFQREYDRHLRRKLEQRGQVTAVEGGASPGSSTDGKNSSTVVASSRQFFGSESSRPDLLHQTIRSLLYMVQFAIGYFAMLLAMYFNGKLSPCPNLPFISLFHHCTRPRTNRFLLLCRLHHHLHFHWGISQRHDLSVGQPCTPGAQGTML